MSADDLVGQKAINTLPKRCEEDEPALVDLLTMPNIQKALKMFKDSITFCRMLTPTMSVGL
jgi:hypothetical protein